MLVSSTYLLALVSCIVSANAASAVLDLIPDNFDEIVLKSGKPALVEFFAPWCGHCKTLAPIYEELGSIFDSVKDKVTIAKVDADANRALGQRFGVQGFPTLKWFDGKSDKPEDYNLGRDLDSLRGFVEEKTGIKGKAKRATKSDVEMLTDSTFKKTIGGDKHVLVAFTAPWCGHCKSLAPVWNSLSTTFAPEKSSVVIAKVDAEAGNSKSTAKENKVDSYPTIKYYPAKSSVGEDYKGGRTEADFVNFINEKAGTHRVPGGGLDTTAGTIAALDALVSKFTGGDSLTELGAQIKKGALEIKDHYAQYYIKVTDKLAANSGYVDKEAKRLTGLVKRGGLAQEKLDDLIKRSNILARFKEVLTGETTVKADKDEL